MKATLLAVLLLSTIAYAQTTPQTPPPKAKSQTGAGAATRRGGMQHRGMQGPMAGQDMKAMVDHFSTMVDKLKADSEKITDPAGKAVAQDNIDLWQGLLDHLKQMQEHMGMMQGMHHEGMGQGTGHMHGDANKPPAQTPPPPKP
jgi:hypothetical protein